MLLFLCLVYAFPFRSFVSYPATASAASTWVPLYYRRISSTYSPHPLFPLLYFPQFFECLIYIPTFSHPSSLLPVLHYPSPFFTPYLLPSFSLFLLLHLLPYSIVLLVAVLYLRFVGKFKFCLFSHTFPCPEEEEKEARGREEGGVGGVEEEDEGVIAGILR